jgi:hypothetical protein
MFVPKKKFIEKEVLNYTMGQDLVSRFRKEGTLVETAPLIAGLREGKIEYFGLIIV